MRTSASTLSVVDQPETVGVIGGKFFGESGAPASRTQVEPIRTARTANSQNGQALRMYTEEQVSEMLQVSLSQLRKWRMKENLSKQPGPPFRKVGRLVRYPEAALLAYINGG
jgi:hypothetical protein